MNYPNASESKIWNPKPGAAKTGEAFTRTMTFSASDVPAMAFPAFPMVTGLGDGGSEDPTQREFTQTTRFSGSQVDLVRTLAIRRKGKWVSLTPK